LSYRRLRLTKQTRFHSACGRCCKRYNLGEYDDRFKLRWETIVSKVTE
jgi:hypothetical protein